MTYEIVSVQCGGPGFKAPCYREPGDLVFRQLNNLHNQHSPCQLYQQALETAHSEIIVYAHDDVTVHDPSWLDAIFTPFKMGEEVVAVGFGGATQLGNLDLYRKPFNIWHMARSGYASNQTDAAVHGERFTGVRRVAVLDAFCLAVRRDWLRDIGGWPTTSLTHHCLDLWLACAAARDGKETWMVGVDCTHHGGGTSVKPAYSSAKWLQGQTLESDHLIPHLWLANEFRDVLPIKI